MGAFQELLETWRSNPTADSTLALCTELSQEPREDVVREVGARAEQWHAGDASVMLAVGRMYLEAGLLSEAQATLVNAGKADARDARPFRYLGEVLLRRGDAIRGEKVLSRSMQLGSNDAETKLWHDRALVYVALQKRVGAPAVAAEVARTLPQRPSSPVPAQRPGPAAAATKWTGAEPPTIPKAAPVGVSSPGALPSAAAPARPRTVPPPLPPSSPPPAAGLPPPAKVPAAVGVSAERQAPDPTGGGAYEEDDGDETTVQNRPGHAVWMARQKAMAAEAVPAPAAAAPAGRLPPPSAPPPAKMPPSVPPPPSAPPPRAAPPAEYAAPVETVAAQSSPFGSGPGAAPPPSPFGAGAGLPPPAPTVEEHPGLAPPAAGSFDAAPVAASAADEVNPPPDLVLQHLARVGVYEPGGGAAPAWEKAHIIRTRGSWVFILATVLFVAAGGGAYYYANMVQKERIAKAASLGDEVEALLHSANVDDIRATDDKLARIFELDSRSKRAAKLWLANRVVGALVLPGDPVGIDSAVHRAKAVEVPPEETAYGKIASFLVEGDLAGAAALLPKWDKKAGKDPMYQLTAGAALERAGDLRAIERYEAARNLDDKLVLADILLARSVLLEIGVEKGKPLVARANKKLGNNPNARALSALAWAVDPQRAKEPPKNAMLKEEDRPKLILSLRSVPYVVQALTAINAEQGKQASEAINSAIGLTVGPAMATQLGFLAIKAGNEKLARKAALRALQFSALYPQARVLASRVALLGGRLDEAKKAIEALDPKSGEVAVVRAVLAYETLDAGEMRTATEAMGEAALKRPDFAALAAGPGVLVGSAYPNTEQIEAMAHAHVPWGELVAADAALDLGELELADRMVKKWGAGAGRAVYSLRASRMYRYQGKFDEALKASERAMKGTTTVPVLIERVYVLVEKKEYRAARELIAKYPSMLGPLSNWLRVLVDGSSGRTALAKIKASQLELFPDQSPLLLRVLTARALAGAKEKRAKVYVAAMKKRVGKHGDVVRAVEALK